MDELNSFRATHKTMVTHIDGIPWEYIASGDSTKSLLILPGLVGIAEMSFQIILRFEDEYRVIIPSYPYPVETLDGLIQGITSILDQEGVRRTNVLGGSFGGMIAQSLVRARPERVKDLVLSHTGSPQPERAEKNRKFIRILKWMPTSLVRALLRAVTSKTMQDAPAQRDFWVAYSNELIARLSKADLISRYLVAVDFDAASQGSPEDLASWPGRILILEGDDDPIAEAPERQALKALHPQAAVHTFHGTGHIASIASVDEYVEVIKNFFNNQQTG
jgi:pimeloyl-ACP methyl ester carboxylesterase